jgi:hypothetical protein
MDWGGGGGALPGSGFEPGPEAARMIVCNP